MLATPRERLIARFRLQHAPSLAPRYNIAPSQAVAGIREARGGERELVMLQWGLIPHFARAPSTRHRMINARAETLTERPAFRSAFSERRCLIPADGYYEWMPGPGRKQPYFIAPRGEGPIAFAGLWERWRNDAEIIESCAIITTEANGFVSKVHDRMPLILPEQVYNQWLDASLRDPAALRPLLKPYDASQLQACPVSTRVNSPRIDDVACIDPLDIQQSLQ